MSEEQNENNEKISHIMFLKEQVLRFAAAIDHSHDIGSITGLNDYAKKEHKSDISEYGAGDDAHYGHVKVNNDVNTPSDGDMPASVNAIKTYINNKLNELKNQLKNELQSTLDIITHIDDNSTNNQIPTARAVLNAIKSNSDLEGASLNNPKSIDKNIDEINTPGYYLQTGHRYFKYNNNENVYYTNAIIEVHKQSNRIVQHVYATSKVTNDTDTSAYKINGSEYTRWGMNIDAWKPWHVAHKPYTKTSRAVSLGRGVDSNSVTVYETTAGFIIQWNQNNSQQNQYPVSAKLYQYEEVCKFSPPLPISGPYVFGNLIGRMDIKITPTNMSIRSTVSPGGRIIEMKETYFVPRNL